VPLAPLPDAPVFEPARLHGHHKHDDDTGTLSQQGR
jgi:hypothetical protein